MRCCFLVSTHYTIIAYNQHEPCRRDVRRLSEVRNQDCPISPLPNSNSRAADSASNHAKTTGPTNLLTLYFSFNSNTIIPNIIPHAPWLLPSNSLLFTSHTQNHFTQQSTCSTHNRHLILINLSVTRRGLQKLVTWTSQPTTYKIGHGLR